MFALTVEQLSRVEYKPSKKEEMKAAKKLAERTNLARDFELENRNGAPGAVRSPIAARRKFNRLNQIFGIGGRRGSLTSNASSVSNASSTSSGAASYRSVSGDSS